MPKFLRRVSSRYSKLGKGRKKKQVWRRPTGRDNKMRERRKGYPARVEVGYKTENQKRNKIQEKSPVIVKNIKDLENIKKNQIAILGKVGIKKKIEIAEKAKKEKIEIYNLNSKKFLKEIDKQNKKKEKKTAEMKKIKEKKKKEKKK